MPAGASAPESACRAGREGVVARGGGGWWGGKHLKVDAGVGAARPHIVDHTVLHVEARAAWNVLALFQRTVLVAPGRAEARGRALRVVLVAGNGRGRRVGPSSSIPVVSVTPAVSSEPIAASSIPPATLAVVSATPVVSIRRAGSICGARLEAGDAGGLRREARAARTVCGLRHRRRAITVRRSSPPGLAAATAASIMVERASITVEAATASAAATRGA